jgi:hypothetical protein
VAVGRLWMGAKYSYGVSESFARQANAIMTTFDLAPTSKSENHFRKSSDLGLKSTSEIKLQTYLKLEEPMLTVNIVLRDLQVVLPYPHVLKDI